MTKKRIGIVILPLLAALGLGLLNAMTPFASADPGATSPISTAIDQGHHHVQNDAAWTITANTFTSQYPAGFTFSIQASSAAGPIVAASVEWVHRADRAGQTRRIRRADAAIDAETGTITAVWAASQSDAVPPWVEVRYVWKLRDEAGNQYETETTLAEYEDQSRTWIRTETDEIIVISTGLSEAFNRTVIEAMESLREKYIAGWGDTLPYRPRVILFADRADFDEWRIFSVDTSSLGYILGGLTVPTWGGTVQVVTGEPEFLAYSIVPHEIEHLYQFEYLAKRTATTPGWFTEGDAVFYETHPQRFASVAEYVAQRVANNTIPALLDGEGPRVDGSDSLEGYYLGYTFMRWINDNWGIAKHKELMALLATNMPFVEALEQALGMSKVEIERAWRQSIGATSDAPTLIPTWTPPAFLPSPTPFTFGNN
ncbi:MAG: hypothetical protein JXA10_16355 [Anaerolineae bacterium]|nr:hypothetical protein [Anaerolineae bacterium]